SPSRYVSRVAEAGAVSRYSTQTGFSSGGWIIMNPPPPMLPASGHVTASANATATAASTAFPPRFRISTPTSLAGAETVTTIPRSPVVDSADCAQHGFAPSIATTTTRETQRLLTSGRSRSDP